MTLKDYGEFPLNIPVIIEDSNFIYPFMIVPIFLSSDENLLAVDESIEKDLPIFIAFTKQGKEGNKDLDSCYTSGVIGSIMRRVSLPDGRIKVLFQGLSRGSILNCNYENSTLSTSVDIIEILPFDKLKVKAGMDILKAKIRILAKIGGSFPQDLLKTINDNYEENRVVDLIASSIKLTKDQSATLFADIDVENRIVTLINYIIAEIETTRVKKDIKSKVHSKIEKHNKEYFLKEQIKEIQKELGVEAQREEEIEDYRKRFEKKKKFISKEGVKEIEKQIARYSRMHSESSDASMLQNYIEWVLDIPFGEYAKKKLNIQDVESQLNSDHYSLEKPKDRLLEYFAVKEFLSLRGKDSLESKGSIICFVGPPGVGKTSLANSIAKALKRSLVRVALGGMEDVNELRGHRRTYIGAMPGRLIQGLIDAKEMNPVVVLDEVDKLGRNHRGDPTSALLEILDPEQNKEFRDYYINFNIDLSNIIFIATANTLSTIPAPLRDRMEFITVNSYTPQEKYQIAKKYLIPQELKKHGLKGNEVNITKAGLEKMIANYTREAGVRNLRRQIAKIFRKSVKQLLENMELGKISINIKNLPDFLDKIVFEIDEADKKDNIGIINGLAWTSVGGDMLKIEAIKIRGKGGLTLTGSLGDVMKESARIAYSVVKILIDENKLSIDRDLIPKNEKEIEKNLIPEASEIYKRYDLHIHVPEGATPKDGPSAGIAKATVIASILSNKKIKSDIAMTGEITLTGNVLPIGGLTEKLIAAHKAKITKVLIPKKNYDRDLKDMPEEVLKALKIIPVTRIEEVLKETLL